jgi:hypothetical protein
MGLLDRDARQRLIELLLRIPGSQNRETRDLLLQDLPPNLVSNIRRENAALVDIANIVNTADSDTWARLLDGTPSLQVIIENARNLVAGSGTADELAKLLATVQGPARPEVTPGDPDDRPTTAPSLPPIPPTAPTTPPPSDGFLILDGRQLRRLQEIMLRAFRDRGSLARMVRFGLDTRLEDVTASPSLSDMAFDLIMWAESQHRLADLIQVAATAQPNNGELEEFARGVGLEPGRSTMGTEAPAPAPMPLTNTDQDRLLDILRTTPVCQSAETLRLFLRRAGVADSWLSNYRWEGSAISIATQLLVEAERQQYPLWGGRPGYTVLGMIMDRLLREQAVGYNDGRYLARLIRDNNLIDLSKATVSPELQSLLADPATG